MASSRKGGRRVSARKRREREAEAFANITAKVCLTMVVVGWFVGVGISVFGG